MRNRWSPLGSGKHSGPGRPPLGKQAMSDAERMRKSRAERKKKAAHKPIVSPKGVAKGVRTEP